MKTLSVRQPWANLICHARKEQDNIGIKDVENRSWKTNFRGRILLHAPLRDDTKRVNLPCVVDSEIEEILKDAPTGAIIGSVEIVDCVLDYCSIWAETDSWNWILANPVLLKDPILNVKGKLSFWEYEGFIPVDLTIRDTVEEDPTKFRDMKLVNNRPVVHKYKARRD